MKNYIIVFLISMLPIIELRGAVLYGIGLGMNIYILMTISVIANSLVVPIIFLLAREILEKGADNKYFGKIFKQILQKGHNVGLKLKNKSNIGVYIALMLFVAIPIPGSGVWTGTLAASLLDLDFKNTVIACILGLIGAFVIMSLFSFAIFWII